MSDQGPAADISPSTFDGLLDDDQASRLWPQLRERLRAEPERVAAPLCAWLVERLEQGTPVPLQTSILLAVASCIRDQPELVPDELLRRLLARGGQLSWLSLLQAGLMLARAKPAGVLTDGILELMGATELVLGATDPRAPPPDPSQQDALRYARHTALDLWRTVARGDPPSIVALLEARAGMAGARHSTRLLAGLLVDAAHSDPSIAGEAIAVLSAIHAQAPGALEPTDRTMDALRAIDQAHRTRELARRVAGEVLAALPPDALRPTGARPAGPPPAPPDAWVDRIIEEYLARADHLERMRQAERRVAEALDGDLAQVRREDVELLGGSIPGDRLAEALHKPNAALVQGVCELVDEIAGGDPADPRIEELIRALALTLHDHPELVPVERFLEWAAHPGLHDATRALLYGRVAAVDPGSIVLERFADAAAVALASRTPGVLTHVGRYAPELLRRFAERYAAEADPGPDETRLLLDALKEVAAHRPEQAEAMRTLVERLRGPAPAAGMIDLRLP